MSEEIPRYKRIVLKLSGESLKGDQAFGIAEAVITDIASQLKQVAALGVEVAVVVGGGNFFRGVRSNNIGIDRSSADYMGMMATIMNGIALRDVLLNLGVEAHHVSPFHIPSVTGPFILLDVIRCLTQKHIVIFSGGTGSPFFTTDTAAALRAVEIKADIFLKATMVDGVYSDDPKKNAASTRFDHLTYDDVIKQELKVIDLTAVTLCKENKLPIKIFDITPKGNIVKAVIDEHMGTLIH